MYVRYYDHIVFIFKKLPCLGHLSTKPLLGHHGTRDLYIKIIQILHISIIENDCL